MRGITSSGVQFSPEAKHGLLLHLPGVTILDTLGASEGMGPTTASRADDGAIAPARFRVSERVRVVDEHSGRPVIPGSDEVGLVAMGGNIPLGYYKDAERTAATFRVFDGERYSVPGDYATVDADGTVRLLGRGSACINTGGEKVYPDEVELVLRKHPAVFDCSVVGVPDRRFGEKVVALVQAADDRAVDASELAEWCRSALAGIQDPARVPLRRVARALGRREGPPHEAALACHGAPRYRLTAAGPPGPAAAGPAAAGPAGA